MNRLLKWLLAPKSTRRGAARRPAGCLLGVERLGGAGAPATGRRLDWSYRPSYEQLEARQMLSATGIISAVTTANHETYDFAIGTDHQLYMNQNMGGGWQRADPRDNVSLTQISAGSMSDSNYPVCWGIEQVTNRVWFFSIEGFAYRTGDATTPASPTPAFTQISANHLGQCYGIAPDHSVWLMPQYGNYSWRRLATTGAVLQATQVSAGESSGRGVAYLVAQSNQVYELWTDGTFAMCPFRATQISAGVGTNFVVLSQVLSSTTTTTTTFQSDTSLYYISAADGLIHHWMGAGHDFSASGQVAGVYGRLCAGTDGNGHDQVFVRDYAGYVRKWDDSGVLTYTGIRADEIAAAGYGFALVAVPGSHDLYEYESSSWWYTYGTAITVSSSGGYFGW